MSLRARMGLVAGGAVALAVIAVAASAYIGARSALRGQIDSELRARLAQVLGPVGPGGAGQQGGGGGGSFGFRHAPPGG
ncbi:MAG: hypothetical protein ABSG43_13790, partial [Solirubrobacteraceae bacterium]